MVVLVPWSKLAAGCGRANPGLGSLTQNPTSAPQLLEQLEPGGAQILFNPSPAKAMSVLTASLYQDISSHFQKSAGRARDS